MTTESIHETVREHYAGGGRAHRRARPVAATRDHRRRLYSALERDELPDAAVLALARLRQPDRGRRPPPGRAGPRPRLGWWHRRPAVGEAGRPDRSRIRRRHDRRDARPRPARMPRRPVSTNVEFLKGHIEALPLPAESIDVVISNCVVNLAADKGAVFAEIARVLRPGGRIGVSDIVADDALEPRATRRAWLLRRLHRRRPLGLGVP